MYTVIDGGLGAARFLQALRAVVPKRGVARGFGLEVSVLPISDDRVRTRIITGEGPLAFQDYFVRRGTQVDVLGVEFDGIDSARPGPGVVEALNEAEAVIVAPSNPFV